MTTTIQPNDSFYLKRLKEYFTNKSYDHIGSVHNSYWTPRSRTKLPLFTQHTLVDVTFDEQEYRGFQLIVIGWHYEMRSVLDLNGNTSTDYLDTDQIKGYSTEGVTSTSYSAYAWEIGGSFDTVANINWISHGSAVSGIGASNSLTKTSKIGMKKIDLLAELVSARAEINSINNERISMGSAVNPYNILIGDQAYILAFGRGRKGVIVKTVGSKFVVGYSTPSNPNELKYKVLPLSALWVKRSS